MRVVILWFVTPIRLLVCKEATMFEQGDGWGAVVNV